LLRQDATLALRPVGSGAELAFLLTGSADARSLRSHLDRLHAGFAARLGTAAVESRVFGEGFPSTIIRENSSAIGEERKTEGGWDVHVTRGAGKGLAFVSAIRGGAYVLGTDEGWVRQIVTGQAASAPLPHEVFGTLLAGGTATSKVSETFLSSSLLSPLRNDIPASFTWSLEDEGQVTTLTLQKQ
jgi:hypothetical protein